MEVASTVAKVVEAAEKVYEGTKEIRKVCNATQEAKNVADSEGKDQLDASVGMAYSVGEESSSFTPTQGEEAHAERPYKASLDKIEEVVFDERIPSKAVPENSIKDVPVFDEGIPLGPGSENPMKDTIVFDEGIPLGTVHENPIKDAIVFYANPSLGSNTESILRSKGEGVSETSLETNRIESFGPENQYISLEKDAQWRNKHSESELDLGKPKSADVLRNNMLTVMGDDGCTIEKSFSRAHHIVGDSDYTDLAKKQLEKFGIDINDPMNGIFLPNDENSPLKGTIHEGRHFKDYCNEVNQRLAGCTSRQDCLEVLDSIKQDLYNGDLALYNDHKFNS